MWCVQVLVLLQQRPGTLQGILAAEHPVSDDCSWCVQVLVLLQRLAGTLQDILAAEHLVAATGAVVQAVAEHAAGQPFLPVR